MLIYEYGKNFRIIIVQISVSVFDKRLQNVLMEGLIMYYYAVIKVFCFAELVYWY